MPTFNHANLTDAELHLPGYVSSSDPGAVTNGMLWIDTSGGAGAYVAKIRKTGGWEELGTFSALTVKKTTAADVSAIISGVAGQNRNIEFQTAGVARWQIVANSTAESGSDAGTDLDFLSKVDAGTAKQTVLRLTRSSGKADFVGEVEINGDLNHDGSNIGVFGTAPTTKKTVTGSRGSNAALTSLLTALAAYGLITDSSS